MGTQSFICSNSLAYAPIGFCRPQLWTRWVRSVITVHKLSNIEEKKSRKSQDSNPGKKRESSYLCAKQPPWTLSDVCFRWALMTTDASLTWGRCSRPAEAGNQVTATKWGRIRASIKPVSIRYYRLGDDLANLRKLLIYVRYEPVLVSYLGLAWSVSIGG